MTPVKYSDEFTIPVAVLADIVQDVLADQLSLIMVIILVLTAILTVVAQVTKGQAFAEESFFRNLFHVTPFWAVTRVLADIFAIMVFFEIGLEAISDGYDGGMLLHNLLRFFF